MPPPWCPFRCLVFLLLAVAAGFLAHPAEAAKRPFADIVDAAAKRHGVDPDLVHAVIAVESGYRATAQSPAGAQGLMQLMPGTQRNLGVSDAFDPRQNVDAGVAYLRRLTDEFGTVLALAAYNAGPGAVRRYNGIPPYAQTRVYVQAVLDRDRPAAGAQATEKHDASKEQAHALSEAGLAEGAPVDRRLQGGHLKIDAAAGLEPPALDAAVDPDDRTWAAALPDQLVTPRGAQAEALRQGVADERPIQVDGAGSTHAVADTAQLVLHHRGMDRLTVDAEPRRNGPDLAAFAVVKASDLGALRRIVPRPFSRTGRQSPTPSASGRCAPAVDPPPSGHATCAPAGSPRSMTSMNRTRRGEGMLCAALSLLLSATPAAGQIHTAPSPVADAAKRQDSAALQALLQEGADVDQPQGDGATALHWAVYRDDLETTRLLLAAGATVGAANDLGVTPLWLACNNGSAALVEALLDARADPDAALPSGETPLMTAARTGNAGGARLLLAHGADANAREGAHGQTALMWAVSQRHPKVVRVLLEHGAGVNDRSNAYPQVVSSAGNADPRGVFEVMQGGYAPLLFAARQGDLQSARLLLAAGADVDDAAASGTSALVVAAHSGHGTLAALLLEAGADPGAAGAGYSALHAAVLRGDLGLVRTLLAHGADPDAVLERGTPARRVSADWTLRHAMIGATPFWLAARFREPEIMRVLSEHGADPRVVKDGETAVTAAIQGGTTRGRFGIQPPDPDEEGRRTLQAVALALDMGADVNAQIESGDTALHLAASRGLSDVIRLLAERGAALDARNARGQTPLGVATSDTVALLRDLGTTGEDVPPAASPQ